MNNNERIRVLMTIASLLGFMGIKDIQANNLDTQEEITRIGDIIYNYQTFMNSEAKVNLSDYLNEDECHSFEEINQDGITTDEVNFRVGPSIYHDKIRMLDPEEHLEVLGKCDNDWYLVRSNKTIGFVYGDYLRVISPEFKESQKLEFRTIFLCAVEAIHGANIRRSPDVKTGEIIGGLSTGDRLPAYERLENGWYRVDYQGQDGYIFGELVKEIYASSIDDYPMIYTMEEAPFVEEPYGATIEKIPANSYYYVLGENQDYFFTQINGRFGYIGKSHCERMTDIYVVVDISAQELKVYNRGKEILSTPVVTGSVGTPTYPGAFYIQCKETDVILTGPGYAIPVKWWMRFDEGRGLHDAGWRVAFGKYVDENGNVIGDIRDYWGTHGCVNIPEDITLYIFDLVHVGDRVFVKE